MNRKKSSAALSHVSPVLGMPPGIPPISATELIAEVGKYTWHETVCRLAMLAAVAANCGGCGGSAVRGLTVDLILASDPAVMTPRGRALWAYLHSLSAVPPVANEACIYFLQALAILYGAEAGAVPTDGDITGLFIAGNQFAFAWQHPSPGLSTREHLVADTTRALTFNRQNDPARDLVRSYEMMRPRPVRRPEWNDDTDWHAFQKQAFGVPLEEYLEVFAHPLVTMSMTWGQPDDTGVLKPPIVNPSRWWTETLIEREKAGRFFDDISIDRSDACAHLDKQKRTDGLVVGPTLFFRRPLLKLPEGSFVAVSPWAMREHLRGGLWGKHRAALKKSAAWPPAFGDLFEAWCQRVARIAAPASTDQIVVPTTSGTDDEVEDLLILKNDKVIFVSIKASTIPEAKMRGARRAQEVVDWFDRFLFSEIGAARKDGQSHGGGAIRKLDAKVSRLRAGGYERHGLSRRLKVFPLVVSYERGLDSPSLYRWCSERCSQEGLLKQNRVAPVTFTDVEGLEGLLALGTRGHSAIDILRQKTGAEFWDGRLNVLFARRTTKLLDLRLPDLTELFREISSRSQMRVFGKTSF